MKKTSPLFCLLLITLLSACAMPKPGMIRDLETLPQDAGTYHGLSGQTPLISPGVQATLYADFLRKHFEPWSNDHQAPSAKEAFWALTHYAGKKLYGQNTLQRGTDWLQQLTTEAQVDSYPNLNRPCVAVTNTSMRTLPTHEPAFYDFSKAGEGYPFDYAQNSLVLAGTPLRAVHESRSGQWVLVKSRFACGWVPVRDIAWTGKDFMAVFNAPAQIALTGDNVPISDKDGSFRFFGQIGTILPLSQQPGGEIFKTLLPARDAHGNAVAMEASISRDDAILMPLPTSPDNFAKLANAMLGRQYGWGGLNQDRDCSATIMDLMTPFGIYLPRNSDQQYKTGNITELKNMSRKNKKSVITEHGVPFLTLIRSPGHIMLYIGQQEGEPIVLQSMWGIKTQFMFGDEGRHVIGRTVITTLEPGKELYNLSPVKGNVLDSVYGMCFLVTNAHVSKFRQIRFQDK